MSPKWVILSVFVRTSCAWQERISSLNSSRGKGLSFFFGCCCFFVFFGEERIGTREANKKLGRSIFLTIKINKLSDSEKNPKKPLGTGNQLTGRNPDDLARDVGDAERASQLMDVKVGKLKEALRQGIFASNFFGRKDHLHPQKLTWNLEMMVSNRNLLFQGSIFRFHVCFGGCTLNKTIYAP